MQNNPNDINNDQPITNQSNLVDNANINAHVSVDDGPPLTLPLVEKPPYKFKLRYLWVIIIYALFAFGILPAIIVAPMTLMVRDNDNFIQWLNNTELAAQRVVDEPLNVALIPDDVYREFSERFPNFIGSLLTIEDENTRTLYHFVANPRANGFADVSDDSWLEEIDGETFIKTSIFFDILSGEITQWEIINQPIIILITNENYVPLPSFVPEDANILFPTVGVGLDDNNFARITPLFASLLNLILFILMFGAMTAILLPDIKEDYLEPKKQQKSIWLNGLMTFVIALVATIAGNVILNFIPTNAPPVAANQLFIEVLMSQPGFIWLIFAVVIFGPIVEEFVFRKAFFGLIPNKWVALSISSLIFGLIHITSEIGTISFGGVILTLIPYLIGGIAFGYAYIRYDKNIHVVALGHMFFNLFAIIPLLLL